MAAGIRAWGLRTRVGPGKAQPVAELCALPIDASQPVPSPFPLLIRTHALDIAIARSLASRLETPVHGPTDSASPLASERRRLLQSVPNSQVSRTTPMGQKSPGNRWDSRPMSDDCVGHRLRPDKSAARHPGRSRFRILPCRSVRKKLGCEIKHEGWTSGRLKNA